MTTPFSSAGDPGPVDPLPLLENKGSLPNPINQGIVSNTTFNNFETNASGQFIGPDGSPLDGTYKAVVMPDGTIRVASSYAGTHAEIAGNSAIQSGGEFEFDNGISTGADITSGHYQPPLGQGYDTILDDAVRNAGYDGPPVQDSHK